jgi:adenylate cyclase class IV
MQKAIKKLDRQSQAKEEWKIQWERCKHWIKKIKHLGFEPEYIIKKDL